MKQALGIMQNVMEIMLDLRLPGEGIHHVNSHSGSMAVDRQYPDAIGSQPIGDGSAEVNLPTLGNLLKETTNSTHIDVKVCIVEYAIVQG